MEAALSSKAKPLYPPPNTKRKSSNRRKCGIQTNMYIILFLCSFSCFTLHFFSPTTTMSFALYFHKANHFLNFKFLLIPLSLSPCLCLNSWIDLTTIFNLQDNSVYIMNHVFQHHVTNAIYSTRERDLDKLIGRTKVRMDSFNQSHQNNSFRFNPNLNRTTHADGNEDDEDAEFSGILDIFVHHARNIHNICIYDNQDVYAKFSLTYNPDETLSTRIINGGGKNPTFNENLRIKITQMDAVLKCEIWMFSRARIHMEDQLLGFALVPISQVVGKGKVTEDYSLSSTDLFHSPAGTVQLTLSLDPSLISESAKSSSISSEVILLDRKISEVMLDPVEYSRIEFPDISVVKENQQMVSEYFNLASHGTTTSSSSSSASRVLLPFLHLGASPQQDDYEMMTSPHENNQVESISPNESIHNSGFLSSSITSLSDDRNSADSIEKKNHLRGDSANSVTVSITVEGTQNCGGVCPDTPTSKKEGEARDDKEANFFSNKEKESNKDRNINIEASKFGQVFSSPLGNINLEAEQSAMQQQIVDMYMRSMQQFTESLAKMKLPMDLDKPEREDHGDVIQNHEKNKLDIDKKKKKDGSRVFYGSRAFF